MSARLTESEFRALKSRMATKKAQKNERGGTKKAAKPKRRPPRYFEALEQEIVVRWARNQVAANPNKYPCLHLLHCSLNGVPMTKGQAGRAIGQGMLAGIPDLFLPYPCRKYHGLYLELKAENGRLSPEQKIMLATLASLGYKTCVCFGHQQAIDAIRSYYERE